jgi:nucleotide-binding universal stress UspA family protein
MTQVLIAVDDSEHSLNAARVAYKLFGDTATYTVVNVADQSPMMCGGDSLMWGVGYPMMLAPSGLAVNANGDEATDATPADGSATLVAGIDSAPIEAAMQVALDVATEAELPNPQVVGEVGDPALAIIEAARHHQADVIVIGSHDRNWITRLFIPSVTGSVVREAEIPVLITR